MVKVIVSGLAAAAALVVAWTMSVEPGMDDGVVRRRVSAESSYTEPTATEASEGQGRNRKAAGGRDHAPQIAADGETPFPLDGRHIDPRDFESAEELLSFHWGSHWPAVQAEILAAGASIEEFHIDEMPTWTELQPKLLDHIDAKINARMEAASALAATWENPLKAMAAFAGKAGVRLPPEAHIDARTWGAIRDLNDRIANASANQISGLQVALVGSLQQPGIATVHPIVFPHVTLKTSARSINDHVWMESVAMDGWAIDWALDATKAPEFAIWREELVELRKRRKALLSEALSPWM